MPFHNSILILTVFFKFVIFLPSTHALIITGASQTDFDDNESITVASCRQCLDITQKISQEQQRNIGHKTLATNESQFYVFSFTGLVHVITWHGNDKTQTNGGILQQCSINSTVQLALLYSKLLTRPNEARGHESDRLHEGVSGHQSDQPTVYLANTANKH